MHSNADNVQIIFQLEIHEILIFIEIIGHFNRDSPKIFYLKKNLWNVKLILYYILMFTIFDIHLILIIKFKQLLC